MRMYLKNNHKSKFFYKKKYIVFFFFFLIIIYLINTAFNSINHYYLNYSENEARKIVTDTITKTINNEILKKIDNDNLYKIIRNKNEEIEMIDFDSYLINLLYKDITENLSKNLKKDQNKINNVSFYIRTGSVFKNPMFANKGPKIPIKLELIGSVLTGVDSKITDYGINNSLIEIFIHVEVKEKIILPTASKDITITNDIPISYKVIKGTVPSYYSGKNSSYLLPVE